MTVRVCLNAQNREIEKILADEFLSRPGLRLTGKETSVEADLYVFDDEPGTGNLLERIRAVRLQCPQASLFVISSDASPEHIVEAMKAGANEYFLKPVNPQKIHEAVDRWQAQLQTVEKSADGKVYAFLGSKGGIGTTLLAVNTAAALAVAGQSGGKIALLDLDLAAGDASVLVDTVPKTTISDIVRNFHRFDPAFLAGVMEKTAVGFDLLAAPVAPEEGMAVTAEQVGTILQHARTLFAAVVLDCPAMTLEERVLDNLRGVDSIFLNTDLSVPAIRNATRQLRILRKLKAGPVEIVVNRFLKGQSATLEEVEKTLDQRVFWLFPNDYENASESVNRGTPLAKYSPRSPLYRNILEFAQKLRNPAAFPSYRGVKGLLGKAV